METIPVDEPLFTKVASDVLGSEGPVFDKSGCFYVVAPEVEKNNKPAGQILCVNLKTNKNAILCEPEIDGYGGIPAGCQFDRLDNLFVADMRLGLLQVKLDGTYKQVATCDSTGQCMQGCNDCAFDYQGNLWITAPAGDIAPAPFRRSMEEPFGSVYCYTNGEMIKIDTGLQFPNGIAVLHLNDGQPQKLIVAETPTKRLWSYDIEAPGKVSNKKVWATIPGDHEGGADGMDFDNDNNLLVANWGSGHIEVFNSEGGNPIQRIKCPFVKPSNIHFKPRSKTLYVTEHENHAVWKFDWYRNGKMQYCEMKSF
ncbi:diisopropyl-fluorophosphatase [Octopus sinensis]|uniref:Diisopropyl-fluorophosphatase n=1 Tax=Octopus sinensis TaxID=2607531 RepID=A0A6P7SUS5_9MOLL|nr:diisopropyl-fluorophosphatase [Octopus sinensis]